MSATRERMRSDAASASSTVPGGAAVVGERTRARRGSLRGVGKMLDVIDASWWRYEPARIAVATSASSRDDEALWFASGSSIISYCVSLPLIPL